MKKFKKISAIIVVIVICLSLCSCRELDELRDSQAYFNQNGIIYKDKLYKAISYADELDYDYSHEKHLKVTDPDVPVLVSALLAFEYSANGDETIICGGYDGEWYIREDKYEIYEKSIKNGINYTDIGFEFFDFDLGERIDYILSAKEKEHFLSLFTGEPANEEFEIYEELYFFERSDNKLFKRSEYYCLMVTDKGYFVRSLEDDNIYKSNDVANRMFDSFYETINRNFKYEF